MHITSERWTYRGLCASDEDHQKDEKNRWSDCRIHFVLVLLIATALLNNSTKKTILKMAVPALRNDENLTRCVCPVIAIPHFGWRFD